MLTRGRGEDNKHAGIRLLLTAVLASGIGLVIGMQAEVADARPLATGVSWVDSNDQLAFQQVRNTGAPYVQLPIFWSGVAPEYEPRDWQPTEPQDPHYDWTQADIAVTQAVDAGLTPLILIDGSPPWARQCLTTISSSGGQCFPRPEALASFVVAAARRYSGYFDGLPRVRYWQALNEPNLSLMYVPQVEKGTPVSPILYRKLINSFYSAVKSVNPSNLVLAAGLGPIEVRPWTIGPMRFTRELLCMTGQHNPHPTAGKCEGGVHFDIFDIHPYTTGGPTHRGHINDVELGDLPKLQELLSAADKAGRIKSRFRPTPLWITEFSWDSKPPDPGGLPMPILKRWTAEALYRAWSAGVSHFFWFSLRDFPPDEPIFGVSLQSGLYFRGATIAEDQPKPNLQAFRFPFVAYTSKTGFTYWGRTGSSEGGRVAIQVREGGRWRNAAVARADGSGIFQGTVTTSYGRGEHGMVRALYRGEEAIPFSLHPVRDFHQAPFGNPVE